jgi:hypothetical protein
MFRAFLDATGLLQIVHPNPNGLMSKKLKSGEGVLLVTWLVAVADDEAIEALELALANDAGYEGAS